jgi:hypothetical protein
MDPTATVDPAGVTDPNAQPGGVTPGETGDGGATPQPKPEPTVPVSVLVRERKEHKERERQLLAAMEARREPPADKGKEPASTEFTPEQIAAWDQFFPKLPSIKKLMEAAEKVALLEEKVGPLSVAANLAVENFHDRLVQAADKVYDPETMPVSRDLWHEIVAAKMTDARLDRLYQGDHEAWSEIMEETKKAVGKKPPKAPSASDRARERDLTKVRAAPTTPGPGGNPPGSPEAPKLKGKALHDRAFARLRDAFERGNE